MNHVSIPWFRSEACRWANSFQLSFSHSKDKWLEQLADDDTWRAEVVLDRYKNLQDPVLYWFIIQHLVSWIIFVPLNIPNSSSHSFWSHYYCRNEICTAVSIVSCKQLAACQYKISQVKRWKISKHLFFIGDTRRVTGALQTVLDICSV